MTAIVSPEYVSPHPIDLSVVRKFFSLNGRDFTVTDGQENPIFRLKEHVFHIHDHRVLLDDNDTPVVTLRNTLLTMHGRWEVFRGKSTNDCDLLFTTKMTSTIQFKATIDVFLAQNKDQIVCDYKLKGNFMKKSCTIYAGESSNIVAKMQKKATAGSLLFKMTKFNITVYPNVDYAFITALTIILDELHGHK